METEKIKDFFRGKGSKHMLATALILALVLVAFWTGMEIGFNKAAFNYRFGENYYGTFGPHDMDRGHAFIPNDLSPSHGVSGKIVSIQLPTLVVADRDNIEKVVHISDDTVVRKFRDTISANDLTSGDFVVIIGNPGTNTQIEAKLIRVVMPPPAR